MDTTTVSRDKNQQNRVLTRDEALELVRNYKKVIAHRFNTEPKVYMYGSYSKGYPNPWSDIDVAVIVPKIEGNWLEMSADICGDVRKVSILIEPILMEEPNGQYSPLYEDVMRTGISV
ncbi:MAG: nucleotidyltransferase domain-containing protein [Prevotella sp.]|nr:nucleotidyltransferase domain-containing protein [Prevotella sp.]